MFSAMRLQLHRDRGRRSVDCAVSRDRFLGQRASTRRRPTAERSDNAPSAGKFGLRRVWLGQFAHGGCEGLAAFLRASTVAAPSTIRSSRQRRTLVGPRTQNVPYLKRLVKAL